MVKMVIELSFELDNKHFTVVKKAFDDLKKGGVEIVENM